MLKLGAMIAAVFLVPGAALAGLEICNKTDALQSVTIGYKSGDNWVSEGWWNIEPGDCKEPVKGDLKNRFYYYRSHVKGEPYASGKVMFCTRSDVFTIVGDSDCEARGFDTLGYRKLDTGKTAKHFTLSLVGSTEGKAEVNKHSEAAPKPPTPSRDAPGTHGEPYAAAAILQGCENEGVRQCMFHDSGTKFFVYDDGRTPRFVFTTMSALDPGTPISVQGDLVGVFDSTAEVVLRDITVRPWDEAVVAFDRIQGQWYSVDDPNAQFTVLGGERENTYDGQITGRDYLWIDTWCSRFEGDGLYLMARPEEGDPEVYCYQILTLEDWNMELMYLPRGNILSYRKLD